jgi:hypothetical protein
MTKVKVTARMEVIAGLKSFTFFNLDSAVQDTKAMQDFESESLLMGAEHSQKVKAAPIKSDCGSKDCVALASSTAESRFKRVIFSKYSIRKDK